eukprot:GILI01001149.1.p2 GENE.GILI01001149.1~~GILI01001149.1.p2  ORF type:complete len:459 (+),score=163.85 GILI01001149.1:42-1379(+)
MLRRGIFSAAQSAGRNSGLNSRVCAVLGSQWGDEGKGKLVDILAQQYDICARFNGGANAGHTLVVDGKKYAFHLLPCGMLYPNVKNLIGNGVVLHVPTMFKELEQLEKQGMDWRQRLLISDRAHLLFDVHMKVDGMAEASNSKGTGTFLGTTKKGIGPCYSTKSLRTGLRVGDLLNFERVKTQLPRIVAQFQKQFEFEYDVNAEIEKYREYAETLRPMIVDGVQYINSSLKSGKRILAEGANAALLDIDFGTYPYVTSSNTTAAGVISGLGLAPSKLDTIVGVVKAYTTRVGEGPFPTELLDEIGENLRRKGGEFGTTTGRPRRCGWLDIAVVRYAHTLNNFSSINITKLDVLSDLPEIKIAVGYSMNGVPLPEGSFPSSLEQLGKVQVQYETLKGWQCDISKVTKYADLPVEAKKYIERIEVLAGCPVSWIGVGPGREAMVLKQ